MDRLLSLAWLRRLVAAVVFLAFVACFVGAAPAGSWLEWPLHLQFVPALGAVISGRVWAWLALGFLLLLTLLFGRVYCSWLCPLGMMQDAVNRLARPRYAKGSAARYTSNHRLIRLLAGLVGFGSILFCGTLLLTWLDPYSIAARFMAAVVQPAAEGLGQAFGWSTVAPDWLRYAPWLLAVVIVSVLIPLGFALLRGRLYCNSICPVGALLGLIARCAPLMPRIDETRCRLCARCQRSCKAHAIDLRTLRIDATRCVACYDCVEACENEALKLRAHNPFDAAARKPTALSRRATEAPASCTATSASAATTSTSPASDASAAAAPAASGLASPLATESAEKLADGGAPRPAPHGSAAHAESAAPSASRASGGPDMSRRAFLGFGLASLATALIPSAGSAAASGGTAEAGSNIGPGTLPPGAGDLDRFLDVCTGCGLCIASCPSRVLRPSYTTLGWRGLMKPYLDYSAGFCAPDCNRCSQVCPTGALMPLSLADKQKTQIGLVDFRQQHCIVWQQNRSCALCADRCPTGAIEAVEVRRPSVNPDTCVGCGGKRCQRSCPTDSITFIIREDNGRRLPVINYATCIGCSYCAEACRRHHGIDVTVQRVPRLHPELCTGCGACTNVCPASPTKAMRVLPRLRQLSLPS